jgi:hypothetical protein
LLFGFLLTGHIRSEQSTIRFRIFPAVSDGSRNWCEKVDTENKNGYPLYKDST